MKTQLLTIAARLSNKQLIAQVQHLARHEREATASLIAHLAVLDERELYLSEGCSSLFTYCVEVLHLSENAAYGRIQAARAARKFPVVLERLATGALNLTNLGLLVPHLTTENHRELLDAAKHQSKRHVEELVAAVRPLPAIPASIRKASVSRVVSAAATRAPATATSPALGLGTFGLETPGSGTPMLVNGAGPDAPTDVGQPEPLPMMTAPSTPRAVIAPLAPDRYKIQFTASAETHAKLRQVQKLLRHQVPDGDLAAIVDRALTVLLAKLEKSKHGATDKPRPGRATMPDSRNIPAAVRRVVWKRDAGRCAFVSEAGRRCSETGFLEFHHVDPHGDGGEPTIENVFVHCRAHNQYESDLHFGPESNPARKRSDVRESPAVYGTSRLGLADDDARHRDDPGNWVWTQFSGVRYGGARPELSGATSTCRVDRRERGSPRGAGGLGRDPATAQIGTQ